MPTLKELLDKYETVVIRKSSLKSYTAVAFHVDSPQWTAIEVAIRSLDDDDTFEGECTEDFTPDAALQRIVDKRLKSGEYAKPVESSS